MKYHIHAVNLYTGDVELLAKIARRGDAVNMLDSLNKANSSEHLEYYLDQPWEDYFIQKHIKS